MNHSHKCSDLVKKFEGCVLKAYPDPGSGGDPWTCGVGATGPGIKRGVVWTQAEADARLDADLARFDAGVSKLIGKAPTTQNQFDALVSLAFNIGLGNLQTSTLLRLHQEGKYEVAATQFVRWNKAAGRIMNGLTRRRMAEAELYRGRPA
jgi:lysozyme